jgi:hypothetical protein
MKLAEIPRLIVEAHVCGRRMAFLPYPQSHPILDNVAVCDYLPGSDNDAAAEANNAAGYVEGLDRYNARGGLLKDLLWLKSLGVQSDPTSIAKQTRRL